jgi:hypothetical protein
VQWRLMMMQRNRDSKNAVKRKRPPPNAQLPQHHQQNAIPSVPGIPIEILPLHWQALKTTSSHFRRHGRNVLVAPLEHESIDDNFSVSTNVTVSIRPSDAGTTRRQGQSLGDENSMLLQGLFNRIDQTIVRAESESTEGRERVESQQRMNRAIQAWLQSIHQWLRDQNWRKSSNKTATGVSVPTPPDLQAPVNILQHLINAITDGNSQIHVQRASTCLMARLLVKSADCRTWLLETSRDTLVAWMDAVIGSAHDRRVHEEDGQSLQARRLWQCEAAHLLDNLNARFGHWYPTLTVALQRFQHYCPNAEAVPSSFETGIINTDPTLATTLPLSMIQYRTTRDMALRDGERVELRVRKLIEKGNACIDLLVPRLIDPPITNAQRERTLAQLANNESDDEEDNIDWVDALDDNQEDGEQESHQNPHALAVERTMAAMVHTSGLQSGQLEIDFAKPDEDHYSGRNQSQPEALSLVRDRLHKVAHTLDQRYMGHLATWIQALAQADSLVEVPTELQNAAAGSKAPLSHAWALVRMSRTQIQRRNAVYQSLQILKRDVASVLSAAQRLGVDYHGEASVNATRHRANRARVVSVPNRFGGNKSLQTKVTQQSRPVQRPANMPHKRNRIQIKYRKD